MATLLSLSPVVCYDVRTILHGVLQPRQLRSASPQREGIAKCLDIFWRCCHGTHRPPRGRANARRPLLAHTCVTRPGEKIRFVDPRGPSLNGPGRSSFPQRMPKNYLATVHGAMSGRRLATRHRVKSPALNYRDAMGKHRPHVCCWVHNEHNLLSEGLTGFDP